MTRNIVGGDSSRKESVPAAAHPTVKIEGTFQSDTYVLDRKTKTIDGAKESIKSIEQSTPDNYYDKLVKLIPGESIAMFLTVNSIIISSKIPNSQVFQWIIYFIGAVGTYFFLRNISKVKNQVQLILSVIAFLIWGYSIGGPFVHYDWYNQAYSAILIPIITFFAPILNFSDKN